MSRWSDDTEEFRVAALFLIEYVHARRAGLGVYGDSRIWRVLFRLRIEELGERGRA